MKNRYSHSKLQTFSQCKLKYKYQYIDKIKTDIPTTIEAFMGAMIHEVLKKLHDEVIFIATPKLDSLISFYNNEWEQNFTPNILIVKSQPAEFYKEKGKKIIEDFYKKNFPFTKDETIALETEKFLELNNSTEYHIRIDRLAKNSEGEIEVQDYKTSSRIKTQSELDQDKQLAMYSYWVSENFPKAKIKLVWNFLLFNQRMESTRTILQLEILKAEIMKKIKEIEATEEFEPTTSPLCNYCEFQNLCPEFKKRI